ncbi:unnamed protein product [Urochloa decumbens]|uniref:Uncharacterized protein n=1 Tax=Urochloa decumbens TaxID=240449 RepID=A0ABC8ZHN5_9POAL
MPIVTECGEGSKLPTSSEEYPCVRRLRHRRLLTLLCHQGFESALRSMAGETDAFFSVSHLRRYVERGQWKDAFEYLLRFLPPGLHSLSLEAQVLRRFLVAHMALANILAGTKDGDVLAENYKKYRNHGSSVCNGIIRLRSIMLTALHAKRQLSDSLDWECVWRKASEIVNDLAYRAAELKDMVLKPGGPMKPHNVLLIGFSSRSRCVHKKQSRWPRASALAQGYLQKRRSLLSSRHSQESCDVLLNKAMDMVADAVDKSLKAGKCSEFHVEHPLQPNGTEGATPLIPQTKVGTFAGPARTPGMPPVTNAGATPLIPQTKVGTFTGPARTPGMPPVTNAGATPLIPQTKVGTFAGPARTPGMPPVTNAGASVAPISWTMFGTSAGPANNSGMLLVSNAVKLTNLGASIAPVSQARFGTLAGPAKKHGMPSVSNAGCVPVLGGPFLGTVFASPVGTVFGGSPSHGTNSEIPLMTNEGATPVSQSMFDTLASSATNSGMPSVANAGVSPVSQAMFHILAGSATNSGIPFVSSAGYATNSGITPMANAV